MPGGESLQCRPKTKGWLFTVAIAVPEAARIWPKQTLVSVLAAMERNIMSFPGGWMVLYMPVGGLLFACRLMIRPEDFRKASEVSLRAA